MRGSAVRSIGMAGLLAMLCSGCGADGTDGAIAGAAAGGSGPHAGGAGGSSGSGGGFPTSPPDVSVLDAHPVLSETQALVHVVLSAAATSPVSVELTTLDDSAKSASGDYQPVTKTVTFSAGMTDSIVAIDVNTPYKTLTLDTALDRQFKTKLGNPKGATISDGDGIVTLAHAGMVIETPLAVELQDGDIVPDFNGDKLADLVLTGTGGKGALLLTPKTAFVEAAHVVVDSAYLDGERAFSWQVDGSGKLSFEGGIFAADGSMSWDQDGDGLSDVAVLGEKKLHMLYGHTGPFFDFASADPRLSDGTFGTHFSAFQFVHGSNTIQTGDFDGDGAMDFGQAGSYSSAEGGVDQFLGFYGAPGRYSGDYSGTDNFGFASGTTPVGVASLVSGTRPGVRLDLNGDHLDDLNFIGLAMNDAQFGGNYMYVRFNDGTRVSGGSVKVNGTLDGTNGFQISNNYPSNLSSFVPQDAGDLNGDGIDDLVWSGGGNPLSVIFGKKTAFASGNYDKIQSLGSEAALFDCDPVVTARIGDLNRDGFGDIVFITENKLRVVWGKKDLQGKPIFGTQYPEMGEIDIDPASGLDAVGIVGDLDADGTADVVIFSRSFNQKTGAALVLFGKTLTRILGGPDFDVPVPK